MSCCNLSEYENKKGFFKALQYRKRYELLQHDHNYVLLRLPIQRYNTASGMSCCNVQRIIKIKSLRSSYNTASGMSCCNEVEKRIDRLYLTGLLQYRKRYELLQPTCLSFLKHLFQKRYNTASGMSCCNPILKVVNEQDYFLAGYNTASGMSCCNSGFGWG